MKRIKEFINDESGMETLEYAVIAGLIAAVAVIVYACESCGFPVSRGRTMCVDCEERGSPSATMARLLTARQKEDESWLSAHGYTIASLLVSALAAAIIYWLH